MTSLEQFIRHAERFGSDCVLETARQEWGDKATQQVGRDLLRLEAELRTVDSRRRRGRYTPVKRNRRQPPETTVRMVRMLREEGFVIGVIADKLGVSDDHVKRCLRESETSRNGVANPHGYAAKMALSPEVDLRYQEAASG